MLPNFTITDLALPFLTCVAYVAIVRLRLWAEGPSDHGNGGPVREGDYNSAKVDGSAPSRAKQYVYSVVADLYHGPRLTVFFTSSSDELEVMDSLTG